MISLRVAAVLIALPPLTAAWAQEAPEPPLWANLAECSAVFAAVAKSDEHYSGGETAMVAQAEKASAAFLAGAVAAAAEGGQADPEADVASIMTYLNPRWENRIGRLFAVRSNLRWIDYCGRIGREERVLPLAE